MNWNIIIFCVLFTITVIVEEIHTSGIFELRLKYFNNEDGRDSEGHCCSGQSDYTSGKCIGTCKTRFRVCLKHYQAKIDTTTHCTFGDVVTPVLGENSVDLTNAQKLQSMGFTNPIQFQFNFTWPGTFTLIVEALHDTNNTGQSRSNNLLIQRLSVQQVLEVSSEWKSNKSETQYTWLEFDFRVTCDVHYYGSGCANVCRPRDDQFGHYTCSETGEIICLSGWEGNYCDKAKCAKGCEHGHCEKPNQCICQPGWMGALCSDCERYPGCVYGTCSKPWECICKEGWGGLFCNQDLNYCTNHRPCQNGGICLNTGTDLYICKCSPGYTGPECQNEIVNCEGENPCQNNGTCINEDSKHGFQCQCKNGWMGRFCEDRVITCLDKPCLHGNCRDTTKGFQCICPDGYSGLACEMHVDNCNPNPCQNGATCIISRNFSSPKCECAKGFTGPLCDIDIDDCEGTNPCQNGGSCIDMVNMFRCQCVPGYLGELCFEKVDLCLTKPCANGGSCTNLNNDYQCLCRAGFKGKDCSIDIDECSSTPCHNGGTCVNRVNSYDCVCANGYRGKQCDEELYSSATYNAHQYEQIMKTGRTNGLTGGQVALIAVLSVAMPLVAVIAACVVFCMKRKRKRAQEKDDAEARKQNEQNTVATLHHHVVVGAMGMKRGSSSGLGFDNANTNVIKNTWDKSVNNMSSANTANDEALLNSTLFNSGALPNFMSDNNANSDFYNIDVSQVMPLQRAKSQKQLNTDPPVVHCGPQMHVGSSLSSTSNGRAPQHSASTKDFASTILVSEDNSGSIPRETAYCSQRWPSGVPSRCSSQLLSSTIGAGNISPATTSQHRTVLCGTPHM